MNGTTMNKNQSKQLKILMKKNESYNEVPLKQFIEFFLKSPCSVQIVNFEYFLTACKNTCVIDIVDTEQTDEQTKTFKSAKVTTIKLKNPSDYLVKKVPVVGHEHHCSLIIFQILLQPRYRRSI